MVTNDQNTAKLFGVQAFPPGVLQAGRPETMSRMQTMAVSAKKHIRKEHSPADSDNSAAIRTAFSAILSKNVMVSTSY